MPVKMKTQYVCQSCGAVHPRWSGQCGECKAWNSIVEEAVPQVKSNALGKKNSPLNVISLGDVPEEKPRICSGICEFDRVCGGGLVPGSAMIIGGDPGIGKSTLLLQVLAAISAGGESCLYVSGEESADQVKQRAKRLGVSANTIQLAATTDAIAVSNAIISSDRPDVIVIDSIQAMAVPGLESAPGTVSQVRAAAQEIVAAAKKNGVVVLFVGHVTKEHTLAGPMALTHLVDAVLEFNGDHYHQYRLLRATKNRFGPVNEIGVFEMLEQGLTAVANPSAAFLADRQTDTEGSAVMATMEGTRPLLVEIQALVGPSSYSSPQRTTIGFDRGRLSMILAVLETRCGLGIGANDIFVNVAGGYRIQEPAADLAVAAAILSSVANSPLPADAVYFGEIGLGGEIRPVSHSEARMREAAKLGFAQAFAPAPRKLAVPQGINLYRQTKLMDIAAAFSTPSVQNRRAAA